MNIFTKIGTGIKSVRTFFSNLFTSKSKRIDYALKFFNAIETFISGSVDDGIISGVAVVSKTASVSLSAVDKALSAILPQIINILEIADINDDTSDELKVDAICEKLKEINNIEITQRIENIVSSALADNKLTLKEIIQLLNTKNQ